MRWWWVRGATETEVSKSHPVSAGIGQVRGGKRIGDVRNSKRTSGVCDVLGTVSVDKKQLRSAARPTIIAGWLTCMCQERVA